MRTTITTGTQFTRGDARPWTNSDGRKVWHSTRTLCEITAVTGRAVEYVVVELLEESGRPDNGAIVPTPGSTGSYLPIAFREAVQRGSVTLLRKGHLVGGR